MNRRNIVYYPVIFYLLLLLVAWLLSWLFGVMNIVDDAGNMRSLMTAEGVRRAVRSSAEVINAAPWGCAMLVVVSAGLFSSSGLLRLFCDVVILHRITINQRRAGVMALLVLLLYIIVFLMSVMAPWRLLMGVTDEISVSPLAKGWLLLLSVGVLSVSGIYGYVYGNFRSIMDVMNGVGKDVEFFIPAFMAILPATALMSCMQYMGVFDILGNSSSVRETVEDIVYFFPFLFVLFARNKF